MDDVAGYHITGYLIIASISIIVVLAISYYFWRWIFSMKRQLWNQKQQINLLIRIAEKLGVDPNDEEISAIKETNNKSVNTLK